jgi:hypothetical protein
VLEHAVMVFSYYYDSFHLFRKLKYSRCVRYHIHLKVSYIILAANEFRIISCLETRYRCVLIYSTEV